MRRLMWQVATVLCLTLAACSGQTTEQEGKAQPDISAESHSDGDEEIARGTVSHTDHGPANGFDLIESVRANLGITFAKVERRRVTGTLRVPGRFETPPRAHTEYRTPMAGRVELIASQYDNVMPGTPLYRLDSPEWRALQKELLEAKAAIETSFAALAVARDRADNLQGLITLWGDRIAALEKLQAAGGGRASELAEARTKKAELELEQTLLTKPCPLDHPSRKCVTAEEMAKHAEHEAAKARFELHLNSAAAILGTSPKELSSLTGPKNSQVPKWHSIRYITVKATAPAVVEDVKVTNGAWVEANTLVYETVDMTAVRFRAVSLQSDIGNLRDDMHAYIVPPQGGTLQFQEAIKGHLKLGLEADPKNRSIELVVLPEKQAPWARPGVSAFLEIVMDDSEEPELAIPSSSIVKDGLETVFFRRNPRNPDQVLRVPADLGPSDGKWTVVYSGIREGDEVVLNGVYELNLATAGQKQEVDPHFGHNH